MNTSKSAAPAAKPENMTRRAFLRLACAGSAGLAVEGALDAAGCTAALHQTLRLKDGRELALPDGRGGYDYSVQEMRDVVAALGEMLLKIVDLAAYAGQNRELPFNQLSLLGMSRTATDLAEEFLGRAGRIGSAISDEDLSRLHARFDFVYDQLVIVITLYRDGLMKAGISVEGVPSRLGYGMSLGEL